MSEMTLGEAAKMIGVSADTLRRWERKGQVKTRRDDRNRRLIALEEVRRLRGRPEPRLVGGGLSARNRLPGRVVSVETDGVMALVEIEAGAHRITAAVTRDSVEELGLSEGDRVFARFQATDVMVELDDGTSTDSDGAVPAGS